MLRMYFELVFMVTEKLRSGRSRRVKKSVLYDTRPVCDSDIILCAAALKAAGFHDCVYLYAKRSYKIIVQSGVRKW